MNTQAKPARNYRAAVHQAFHHGLVEALISALILLSVGLILGTAVEADDTPLRESLERLSDLLTWFFVAELALRAWAAPNRIRFLRRYWLDLISVLPVTRPLRLLRVLRLLRLFRVGSIFVRRLSIFRGVVHGVGNELSLLGTATLALVLTGAMTLFLAEQSENPEFQSLPRALWYTVFSLIAGEPTGGTPVTTIGRIVTVALMLGGMTVFAMFVGTVSAAMVNRFSRRTEVGVMDVEDLQGHIVVCGWNHTGPLVLEELMGGSDQPNPKPVVVVTEAETLPEGLTVSRLRQDLLYHVSGDYTRVEVLERAGVAGASAAILLSDKTLPRSDQDRDARTVLAALTVERLSPGIFTCAELRSRENESLLRRSGVEEIVVSDEYSGRIMGSVGRTHGLVATLDEILSTRYGNAFYKVEVPANRVGQDVQTLHQALKQEHGALLVALERHDGTRSSVKVNPGTQEQVREGDHLVVIADHRFTL